MKASSGQKFCRSCGFGLDKVEQLIAEPTSDKNLASTSNPIEGADARWRYFWFSFFITVFLFHVVMAVVAEKGAVYWSVGSVVSLLGILASGAYILLGRNSPSKQKSSLPAPSTNAPTTKKLLPQPGLEMNASVTEQTTANLAERIEN